MERIAADRIFVACGGIGTTRLVLGSLGAFDRAVYLQESVQFVMPTVSMRPVPDPRLARNFTSTSSICSTTSPARPWISVQVHFYDYNPAFLASLPGVIRQSERGPGARGRCCGGSPWVWATCRVGGHRG